MTTEEAIKELRDASDNEVRYGDTEHHYNEVMKRIEAFDMAIKALEQQPSEDCINRKEVNVLVDELARAISDERCFMSRGRSTANIMQDILDLPSVTPTISEKETVEDCISRPAVDEYITNLLSGYLYDEERTRLEDLSAFIWELPSVQPTRPTGKWKKYLDEGGFLYCECSNCGLITNEPDNYCPNCGARMAESEDKDADSN